MIERLLASNAPPELPAGDEDDDDGDDMKLTSIQRDVYKRQDRVETLRFMAR